jgi:hypothetical protein
MNPMKAYKISKGTEVEIETKKFVKGIKHEFHLFPVDLKLLLTDFVEKSTGKKITDALSYTIDIIEDAYDPVDSEIRLEVIFPAQP